MRIKLKNKDFKRILENYHIGEYKSHKKMWWSIKNSLFTLYTTKGKFVLKVFENSNLEQTKWVLTIIEKLREKGVPIAKTYLTKSKKLFLRFNSKYLVIQEFVKGKERAEVNTSYAKELARVLGLIDKNLVKIKLEGKHIWGKSGYQFFPSTYRSSSLIDDFQWDEAEKKIILGLNKVVNKESLRRSIIHSDFASSNLIIKNDKIMAVLDWDDMHEDYLVSEPAIAISHMISLHSKFKPELVKNFYHEYEKYIKLNANEKIALFYFIKIRLLSGIVWCDLGRKKYKDKARKLGKWAKSIIKFYKEFDKLSLEEFIKLLK